MAAEKSGKGARGGEGEATTAPATEPQLYFIYDEQGQLIGEYDQNCNAVREMVWLENLPIGLITEGSLHHIHPDHLGTPRAITDPTGTVVWRWDSDPFGTTAANDDPDGDGHKTAFNLRFSGQYFDGETGLHYNYFRDYDPRLGRYNQIDKLGLKDHLNPYLFVAANPSRYSDPFGLARTEAVLYEIKIFSPSLMLEGGVSLAQEENYRLYVSVEAECLRSAKWRKTGWIGGTQPEVSIGFGSETAWPKGDAGISRREMGPGLAIKQPAE